MNVFPHGTCECDTGNVSAFGCCGGTGPAAREVTRNSKRIKVCTRCDLSSDTEVKLLVTKDEKGDLYMKHDALGAICLSLTLEENK